MLAADPTGLQALDPTFLIATVLVSTVVSAFVALAVEWLAKPALEVRKAAKLQVHDELRQLRRRWSRLRGLAKEYVERADQPLGDTGPVLDSTAMADAVTDACVDAADLVPVEELPIGDLTRQLAVKAGYGMVFWTDAVGSKSTELLKAMMTLVLLPLIDEAHVGLHLSWWELLARRRHRRRAQALLDRSFQDVLSGQP